MNAQVVKKNNVVIDGNVDAPNTIVFAHGFGTDQHAWANVKDAFRDDYKLVLYDNVGAGNADPEAFSPNKYAVISAYGDDLVDILKSLDLKDVIVVAHSVSSMATLYAAIKAPELIAKVIFISASPRYLNDENYIGGFEQDALNQMYETMTTNYYAWVSGFSAAVMGNPDKPELGEAFAKTLGAIRPDIALSVARVIFQSDIRSELSKLQKETLLVQPSDDLAVPREVAQYLNKHIVNSKLVVVNASGHFPHISAPDEVIAAIKSFI